MSMKKIIFLFCLFIPASIGLFAETLSLEQVRTLALANSRSLAKINLSLQNSKLDEKSQLYSMLPSISANYGLSASYLNDWVFENPLDTYNASASISIKQILFQGGKSFLNKALNEIATESVKKDALSEYFNVLDSVDNAYYEVLKSAASLEAAESDLDTSLSNLAVAEIRQSNGMLNRGDYLKALADKEDKENSRNLAKRTLSLNITKIKSLIGIKESFEPERINFNVYENVINRLASVSDEEVDKLYDDFLKVLVQSNPSLAKSALSTQRAEKNLSLAKRDYTPTISATIVSAGVNYSAAKGFESQSSGSISITGSIPLDFWVMNNKIQKSKNARDAALLDYISAETQIETDLQSYLIDTLKQAESVLSSQRSLEYNQLQYDYVNERYRLSQSSVSDLYDASSSLITSRNRLINSRFGFLQSLSKLRSLGAIDDEERLIKILMGNSL